MSLEIFLKLDGIDGESKDDDHTGEIEINSFSWGVSHPSSVQNGWGSSTGQADVSDFSIMKFADIASPKLMLYALNGKTIASGMVTFRKTAGDSKIDYLTYQLSDVFCTSVQQSAGGGDQVSESVSFSARQFVATYYPQNADGSKGDKQQTGWDLAANKAASA
jgi:type VI secretion system secreted protein Hcp